MRRIVGRVLIYTALLFLMLNSRAMADALPVGAISFDQLVAGGSGTLFAVDVVNSTQAAGGSPVTTFLTFSNLTLKVLLSGGGSENVALNADAFGGFSTGAIFAAGDISSAALTGIFSQISVTLADGSRAVIDANFTITLSDPAAGSVQGGDFAVINANTVVQGAPEPSTLWLLVAALVCLPPWRWTKWSRPVGSNLRSAH
jgi:hypothetical protein